MAIGIRAITDEQKAVRRQHIVDAAKILFKTSDFKHITMAKIAKQTNLAKGTLFLYFKTKEEVFLNLARQEIGKWNEKLVKIKKQIKETKRSVDAVRLVDLLMESLDNEVLVRLLAILDDTLEQNIDFNRAYEFKTFLKQQMVKSGNLIEEILPDLKKGHGIKILQQSFICLIGTYKICNPSQIVKEVIKKPGLELFDRNFHDTLKEMLICQIRGFGAIK